MKTPIRPPRRTQQNQNMTNPIASIVNFVNLGQNHFDDWDKYYSIYSVCPNCKHNNHLAVEKGYLHPNEITCSECETLQEFVITQVTNNYQPIVNPIYPGGIRPF